MNKVEKEPESFTTFHRADKWLIGYLYESIQKKRGRIHAAVPWLLERPWLYNGITPTQNAGAHARCLLVN